MTTSLSVILHEWTEVFMHRSMRDFKRFMDENGLSPSQVSALMRLHHHGTCGVSEIGENAGITNAAASQMMDRLFQMGLIERSESPDDRRAKQLALTAKGHALVDEGVRIRLSWMEKLVFGLTPDQQTQVGQALMMLTQAAKEIERQQEIK